MPLIPQQPRLAIRATRNDLVKCARSVSRNVQQPAMAQEMHIRDHMTFSLTEHTADIGIHIETRQLTTLFEEAAAAMFSVIVENNHEIEPKQSINIAISSGSLDFLLLDWLTELLMLFELRKLVLTDFQVEISTNVLKGTGSGEPVDLARHHLAHEVKAVTYQGLHVTKHSGGWTADVVLDI